MLENYLCDISKPDIRICSTHTFLEGHGKGAGWAFVHAMGIEDGVLMKNAGGGGVEDEG